MFQGLGLETESQTPVKRAVPSLGMWKTNLRKCGSMYDRFILKFIQFIFRKITIQHIQLTVIAGV